MGGSFRAHFALFVVQFAHLLVKGSAALLDGFHIHHVVAVSADCFHMGDNCFNLFIAEYSTDSATSGLFQTDFFALDIIKTEVQHPDQGVFGSSAC